MSDHGWSFYKARSMDLLRRHITSLIFLSVGLTPTKAHFVDFRSHLQIEPIVIERQSPAYAAFEDMQTEVDSVPTETNSNTVARVGRELAELIQSRALAASGAANVKPKLTLNTQVIFLSAEKKTAETARPPESKPDHLAKLIHDFSTDVDPLTVTGLAEILVTEELARREESQGKTVRKIETQFGNPITVAKPSLLVASAPPAPKERSSGPAEKNENKKSYKSPKQGPPPKDNFPPEEIVVSTLNGAKDPPTQYSLRGPITFTGGAALIGSGDEMVVHQMIDGLVVQAGYVNVHEARYEILISDMAGEVQVRVQSRDGQIRALGHLNLYELQNQTVEKRILRANFAGQLKGRLEGQEITVRPVVNGLTGRVISAASYGKTVFDLEKATVHVADLDRQILRHKGTGRHEDLDIAIPSNALIRAQQEKFWPTLAFAESGTEFKLRLFPTSLVEALFGLTLEKYAARESENKGVIWGRVTYGGRPVAGAKVDLVGENKITPVYFNGFLPDKTKTNTTERGEFAFTRLEDAEEMIRVSLGTKIFWPVMVPIAKRFIYYADLEIEPSRTIELKSYDAFSAAPIAAQAQPVGTQEEVLISDNGTTRIAVDTLRGLSLIEAQASESYMPTRVSLRSTQIEVNFAHVKRAWLEEMRKKIGIAKAAASTVVVGFVEGEDYEVMVAAGGETAMNKTIVYFDRQGQVVAQKHGVSGGGFLVFDLPRGIHTLTLLPVQTKKVITQTVYADEFAAHLLQLNLVN